MHNIPICVNIHIHTHIHIYIVCILVKNTSDRAVCLVWFHFLKTKTQLCIDNSNIIKSMTQHACELKEWHKHSSRYLLVFTSEEWNGEVTGSVSIYLYAFWIFYSLFNFLIKINPNGIHIAHKKQIKLVNLRSWKCQQLWV